MLFFDLFRNNPDMIEVHAGQALFNQGDQGRVMYVLVIGEAVVKLGDMVLDDVGAGAILGEMAVVDGSPRSTTVIAKSDCTFIAVDRKRFRFLIEQSPHFAIDVIQTLAQRLRQCDPNPAPTAGGGVECRDTETDP